MVVEKQRSQTETDRQTDTEIAGIIHRCNTPTQTLRKTSPGEGLQSPIALSSFVDTYNAPLYYDFK